jgi:predicted nucleic acid-binding protein
VNPVYVDTGAWIALLNGRERLHTRAVAVYASLADEGTRLVTSSDVIDETATRLRYDVSLAAALDFRDAVAKAEKSRLLRVLQVDASTQHKAFALWEKFPKVTLSLTDATSAVLARSLSIKTVFSFDADFRALGFTLLS